MSEFVIKNPEAKDLPALKSMWKEIFEDDDRFIELFFKYKFSCERSLAVFDGDKLASMLFFPDYGISMGGEKSRTGYICGAATSEQYRGQGIMYSLLCHAHDRMRALGDRYSVLIPATEALYGFYERSGYSPLISKRVIEHNVSDSGIIKAAPASSVDDIWDIYKDAQSGYLRSAVLQSRKSYKVVIEDFLREGRLFLLGGFGYAFVGEQDGGVRVSELILDGKSANDDWKVTTALNKIGRRLGVKSLTCCCPPQLCGAGRLERAGMIRPLVGDDGPVDEEIYMSMMLD